MSMQKNFNLFRQMFPEFVYESFHYDVQSDGLHISFSFRIGQVAHFEPTAFIPSRSFLHPEKLDKKTLDILVFNIGMVELVSYWKCYCPPTVIVKPAYLEKKQIEFWKKLYFYGLGEFFYTNGIKATQDSFMTIRCDSLSADIKEHGKLTFDTNTHNCIVPIGGGKDSVVTLEILRSRNSDGSAAPLPLIMNPRGATIQCVEKAGYSMDDVIVIQRTIHPRLLELNKQGALNGHTPFSAMLAFYSLLASALSQTSDIALSNENSANESTVIGSNVNHQYSKSIEFEDDFIRYVGDYISPWFNYFSFLRPLSELQIAMLFARQPKYFDVFKSCNVGSKEDIWCGHCAKCLFAYIILSPFIEPERLEQIFGKNMLDDETMRLEFEQLTGRVDVKPFECVGTVSEVNSALSMTVARWYYSAKPALLRDYQPQFVTTSLNDLVLRHNLNADYFKLLEDTVQKDNLYEYTELFNLLAFKHILIAGYGREGKSSEAMLNRLFPRGRNYDIAHNNEEIISLLDANSYDLVLKSPGVPTSLFDGHCNPDIISSQTDIFLQVYGNRTIGVTGTKGKSTTATLIHHVLSEKGHPWRKYLLAGNIGVPLFDIIPQIDSNTTVIAELSCHQLENIHRAPFIGLLLNLFQEHLDHYRSYEDYKMAKFQIALKQGANDYFIYCKDNADIVELVEKYGENLPQTIMPYSLEEARDSLFLEGNDNPLKGDHNISNIYACSLVTGLFGITWTPFQEALSTFKGLDHRLQKVATKDEVTYYNDSISTIPQTTIAAIEALKDVDTLILGGMSRGIDYSPLAHYLNEHPLGKAVHNIVLFGSAGEAIKDEIEKIHSSVERRYLDDFSSEYSMEKAVSFAAENTAKGKICLLSPAASSYDHYKNFEERGAHYMSIITNS